MYNTVILALSSSLLEVRLCRLDLCPVLLVRAHVAQCPSHYVTAIGYDLDLIVS